MHGGQFVLALVLVGVPALCLAGMARRHRARGSQGQLRAGGGLVSGWLDFRRKLRLKQVDAENTAARLWAQHHHRLAEQKARDDRADARAGRRGAGPGGTPAESGGEPAEDPGSEGFQPPRPYRWRATVTHVWSRWHPAGDATRPGAGPAPSITPGAPQPAGPGPVRPGPPGPPEPPVQDREGTPRYIRPSRPAPGPTALPTLEGTIVSTPSQALAVPGVEQIIEGCNTLGAYAMAGNAQAKRGAVLGGEAAARRLALVFLTLSRAMAEPGMHYGPEVTEPAAAAAVHFTAAASSLAESDAGIAAIIAALRELEGRTVPHYNELQETGAR